MERYDFERPEKDYPEHKLWPRKPRNASPTREKDTSLLSAFLQYFEMNKSFEPLQSNYLQADNDNYAGDPDHEVGDGPVKPERDLDAEMESRPSLREMEERWSVFLAGSTS